MQMAATAAAGVHHRAVDGTAVARRRGLHEGTARWCTKGCVTKVGRGWPPEPATRNSGTPRVGQEGGKKSDKTMERNLNYAPRKMAIVCKAMLIRRRRKRGRAPTSQTLPDAEPSFLLLAAGIVSSSVPSFFSPFSSFSVVHSPYESHSLQSRRFLRTLRTVSPPPPVGLLSETLVSFAFFPRDLSLRVVLLHVPRTIAVI